MYSQIDPTFLYTDISRDICEHDLEIVSDLLIVESREVYRGERDPRYTHADVFWLYDDQADRVGCLEHDKQDNAKVYALWFRDSPFGTLFQQDGWDTNETLWGVLPRPFVDFCLAHGHTTPLSIQEQALKSSLRLMTPEWIVNPPTIYECVKCWAISLYPLPATCQTHEKKFTFNSVLFVDSDLNVYTKPQPPSASLQEPMAPEQGQVEASVDEPPPQTEQLPPPPPSPTQELPPLSQEELPEEPPPLAHPQTYPEPLPEQEEKSSQTKSES